MSRKSGESMRKSWPICYHFCSDWEGLQMAEPGKVRTAFGVGFANGSRARSRACADYRRPRDHAPRFALSPRCRPALPYLGPSRSRGARELFCRIAANRSRPPRLLPSGHRRHPGRSEEHTSELQSLMSISYDVFCLKKKTLKTNTTL